MVSANLVLSGMSTGIWRISIVRYRRRSSLWGFSLSVKRFSFYRGLSLSSSSRSRSAAVRAGSMVVKSPPMNMSYVEGKTSFVDARRWQ